MKQKQHITETTVTVTMLTLLLVTCTKKIHSYMLATFRHLYTMVLCALNGSTVGWMDNSG